MADIPGLCGPRQTKPGECLVAWGSNYPRRYIGIYPSQFLPSSRTIWHAVFTSSFMRAAPPSPLGRGSIFTDTFTIPFLPTMPIIRNFQSLNTVIFAKTKNRFNVRHVITDEERRTGEINLGEYVFAALAITEQKIVLEQQLTQEEKDNLEDESEEDRIFRNLFEHQNEINPYSRLKWTENWGIKPNVFGLEYRLDNGSEKSVSILDSAGIGDIDTGSYLDGSSKVLLIDLDKHISTVHGEDDPEENVIYLTYVAIDKHYIRQRINASWQFFDGGLQDNVSLPLSIKVVHYRFYEWKLEDGTEIAGWRAVESYFAKPNVTAAIAEAVPVLGDFVAGPKVGLNTITYMCNKENS